MSLSFTGVGGALTPAPTKTVLPSNYLGSDIAYTSQFLPDVHEKEFAKYGNRSVSSFLRLVGAEVPFASDLIQWSEQGRLHLAVTGATRTADVITSAGHPFRANQTVVIKDADGTQEKAIILDNSDLTADTFAVASYENANLAAALATSGLSIFAFGSEFKKGTAGMSGSLEAPKDIQSVKPIIIKDKYEINGSDMAQISWIEVESDAGSGYFWYLKSETETRKRFEDYLELALIEGREAAGGSGAATAGYGGTKGLFQQVETRGNIATGSIADRSDIENLVKVLDKEGAIQENVLFVNRAKSFEIDQVLASLNTYGSAGAASYGMFDNDEDMALSLGFSGFNLGYDFYKSDWKYLNDATTGGLTSGIDGLLVPAGTTSVYDEVMGESVVLPFLHVKYRQTATENRKYKSWLVGSAGGASNSDTDAMAVHFLSERALCVMGANNFILLK
jgi:hypothetical protein